MIDSRVDSKVDSKAASKTASKIASKVDVHHHHHDDEHDEEIEKDKGKKFKVSFWALLGVVLLVLIPRFYFLFFKADIQTFASYWYGDVFHHWMVGYLTKEIGLSKGFLRLWDLKGMEYYWGLLHPMTLVGLFKLFKSADILIVRLFSLVCGVVSVAFVWLIVRRYWNKAAAWGAVLLASLSPIGIFSDASGMTDSLSTMLVLWAIYLWPRRAFWAGMLLAFSAMNRAEYWLFSAGLIMVSLLSYRNWDKRIGVLVGWLIPIGLYMKYLLDWTNNPIYPLWQNFLATGKGDWFVDRPLTEKQILYSGIAKAMFVGAVLVSLWVGKKRPKGRWLWFFGLMNMGFVTFMLGFAAYKQSWMDRIWVDRLWNWPQMFVGIFLAVAWLYWLPKKLGWWRKLRLGWLSVLGVVAGSQLLWLVIVNNGGLIPYKWGFFIPMAKAVAGEYTEGSILLPEVTDFLAYGLYKNGVEGKHFVGQMFGPFYYMEEDPFVNWGENREKMRGFLEDNEIKLVVNSPEGKYLRLALKEPGWFRLLGVINDKGEYSKVSEGRRVLKTEEEYASGGLMSIWQVDLSE